jgi:regulator of protease activity HflC (stomatin/prohibitin superfamily)
MADEQVATVMAPAETQLTQARVPLDEAADVFAMRDASGRIPIVVVPVRLNRVRNELVASAVVLLIVGVVAGILFTNWLILPLAVPVAIVLFALGVYRSFMVRIPEGVNALLAKGGRYFKTIGSGTHVIPPWIIVTHLVAQREIPFDVPVVETLSSDNVRASVDILVTFSITDPYHFVYNISADDFDHVFQAACQDGLRQAVRGITSEQVVDLKQAHLADLRDRLASDVERYGVTIAKINITYAQPQVEFVRSKEARQLAAVQQAEQAEKQALALRRRKDEEELEQQKVIAHVERQREVLRELVQQAEARQRVVELEAESEALRLAKLEERLKAYPLAAQYELEQARLEVARSLAGNTKAVLQLGNANDIVQAFVMRDMLNLAGQEKLADGEGEPQPDHP